MEWVSKKKENTIIALHISELDINLQFAFSCNFKRHNRTWSIQNFPCSTWLNAGPLLSMICAFFKSPYNSTNNFDDTPVTLQNDKILKDKSLGFIFPILKCSTKTVRIIYSAIIQVVFLASKTFFQRSA